MSNYAIDDGFGNELAAGLQEHNARRIAQELADQRGASVWLYETGEGEEARPSVEFGPGGAVTWNVYHAGARLGTVTARSKSAATLKARRATWNMASFARFGNRKISTARADLDDWAKNNATARPNPASE